jgi:hypothetical protein
MSVRLPVQNNSVAAGRIFMKFDTESFIENISKILKFHSHLTRIAQILGAFTELRKGTIGPAKSARISAWNNYAPTGQIFMKFGF